nr:MAG TPA: hypothetical protein [Caudoviricetes sp.]
MNKQLPEHLTCATCLFATESNEDGLVECRRFPPETWQLDNGEILQVRPLLYPTNGCGEHFNAPEESPEEHTE